MESLKIAFIPNALIYIIKTSVNHRMLKMFWYKNKMDTNYIL